VPTPAHPHRTICAHAVGQLVAGLAARWPSEARRQVGLSQRNWRCASSSTTAIRSRLSTSRPRTRRRNPPSPTLLKQFAAALNLPTDYVDFLAGQSPDDLRFDNYARDKVQAAFHAFCRSVRCDGRPR